MPLREVPGSNVLRLRHAAEVLRERGLPGDDHAARMLELCEPIATYWMEPYASPFVPLLETALRLCAALEPGAPVPPQAPSSED